MAASKKTEKYSSLSSTYKLDPTAVENLGTISSSTLDFLVELRRQISSQAGGQGKFILIPTDFCGDTALQLGAFARFSY